MRQVLSKPELYQLYQVAGGFFGARLKAFHDYVDFSNVRRVFDIGCGPGHIVQYMPDTVEYVGFDTEAGYIDFANRRFGKRGRFFAQPFDRSSAATFGVPDLILMNGVLHHMDDDTASTVLGDAASMLTEGGALFTLDGCYRTGQNPVSRYLLDKDRGEHVRTADGYQALLSKAFPQVEVAVRDDLSWMPYTFAIGTARGAAAA